MELRIVVPQTMIGSAGQTPASATKAVSDAAVDRPAAGRRDTDINYPLKLVFPRTLQIVEFSQPTARDATHSSKTANIDGG